MSSSINYKDTLLEQSNLTPIHGKPTFKTLHNIRNKIKANAKSVYSNIRGVAHGHISLVFVNAQYMLILNMLFVCLTHLGPLIIQDGTTAHKNLNMRIADTKEVRLFRKMTGVKQSLVKHIVATVEEAYFEDIHNIMMNSINETVAEVLTHLQENYSNLMTHKLLERKDIVK